MFGFAASPRNGAAAGAVAIGLYAAGGLLVGTPDDFGAPAAGAAAYFNGRQTEIQIGSALFAASAPFVVWFLATVARWHAMQGRPPPARARSRSACGCCGGGLRAAGGDPVHRRRPLHGWRLGGLLASHRGLRRLDLGGEPGSLAADPEIAPATRCRAAAALTE
jgi:hypothetical protein